MEVLIKVSEDLERHLEYIPKEVLSDVLSNLINEGIRNKLKMNETSEETGTIEMETVFSLLKGLAGANIPTMSGNVISSSNSIPMNEIKEEKVEKESIISRVEVISKDDSDFDDDGDDLDDLMDLMK